jgi:DNA-directed RNA polymerase specialized sigma24 family protein
MRAGEADNMMSDAVTSERGQLINLAYRLLGSLADAEDAVQETYTRWYAMTPQQQHAIASPGAWLTTVASRICLDVLTSARVRRERYVGEWIRSRCQLPPSGAAHGPVAVIVGRTPAACRQLASSARRRVRASQPPATPTARQAGLVKDFKQAWEANDIAALISLLDPGAMMTADGGGLVSAALRPIEGGEKVARYLVGLADRTPGHVAFLERTVNGRPGLVAQQDGVIVTVFAFDIASDRITRIWAVRNPSKLGPWTALGSAAAGLEGRG